MVKRKRRSAAQMASIKKAKMAQDKFGKVKYMYDFTQTRSISTLIVQIK